MKLGPGMLVAAAFIGPGTVTTCVLAGYGFGTSLLWALVFATFATIVLQDMAARLGAGAKLGLGEAIVSSLDNRPARLAAIALVLTAIGLGNVAYQGGNLAGGALGFSALAGDGVDRRFVVLALAAAAGFVILRGKYPHFERLLIVLVLLMSAAFCSALVLSPPDWRDVVSGLVPRVPAGAQLSAIALIGTTIVPYNLFLHAAAARERFGEDQDVASARLDTIVAVGLGGLVSCAVLLTAASVTGGGDGEGLTSVLEQSFGPAGKVLVGLGLLAAGFTSAITAPMAAGFVVSELLTRGDDNREQIFRVSALIVLGVGTLVSILGIRPTTLIVVAQASNGLLLPCIAVYLLIVMNRRSLIGDVANGFWSNVLGAGVVVITVGLGLRGVSRALGLVG